MLWPIFSILSADATVVSLVGNNPYRIFEDVAPQDINDSVTLLGGRQPYVVWQSVGGRSNNYLGDTPGIDNPRVQIDCYADTKSLARTLAIAVRGVVELHALQIGQPRTDYISSVKLYLYSMDFSFWVNR